MAEIERLSGCIEWIDSSFVERRWTPRWAIQVGIRCHLAGMSTRDASRFLDSLRVQRNHVAIHNGRLHPDPRFDIDDLPEGLQPTARHIASETDHRPSRAGSSAVGQLVEAARICIGVNFSNLASASLARSMEAFTREYTTDYDYPSTTDAIPVEPWPREVPRARWPVASPWSLARSQRNDRWRI